MMYMFLSEAFTGTHAEPLFVYFKCHCPVEVVKQHQYW